MSDKPATPLFLDAWSCDPRDIPPWTDADKQRLCAVLAQVFGWETATPPAASPDVRPVDSTPPSDKA